MERRDPLSRPSETSHQLIGGTSFPLLGWSANPPCAPFVSTRADPKSIIGISFVLAPAVTGFSAAFSSDFASGSKLMTRSTVSTDLSIGQMNMRRVSSGCQRAMVSVAHASESLLDQSQPALVHASVANPQRAPLPYEQYRNRAIHVCGLMLSPLLRPPGLGRHLPMAGNGCGAGSRRQTDLHSLPPQIVCCVAPSNEGSKDSEEGSSHGGNSRH